MVLPVFGQIGQRMVGLGSAVCVAPGLFVTARGGTDGDLWLPQHITVAVPVVKAADDLVAQIRAIDQAAAAASGPNMPSESA